MRLSDLDALARRQHGVVARRQTELTEDAWNRAIRAGTMIRLHPGVARLDGTASTSTQRIAAAVLAAGPGALASHRSAAHLHGIPGIDDSVVDIIVPRRAPGGRRPGRATTVNLDGVAVHRPRDLMRLDRHRADAVACTNLLRTVVDLGAVDPASVHGAVGHILTNRSVSIAALESVVRQHSRPGRAGVVALRRAIADWSIEGRPAYSVLEPAMRDLVACYGLPPLEFQPRIGGREVDFRVVGTPIVLECDGWAFHGRDRERIERDRANDAEFAANGWIVLRFTYRAITSRPAAVAGTIRAAIERWTERPAPDAA
ncbi:DUF559 domain-containing protein [Ilumatobacter sp.]|uniref:DUF559 domain-containing protein n=1 Tax=Ilumatobacter sp. TaxID=1967498 RepID=UPI003B528B74